MFQEVLDIPKYTNPERVRMMHDGFARWRTNLMVSIQKGEKMCCLYQEEQTQTQQAFSYPQNLQQKKQSLLTLASALMVMAT